MTTLPHAGQTVSATTEDSSEVAIPLGMTEVTRDEFWGAVKAATSNLMPSPRRESSDWMIVGTTYRWGWVSVGYASPHDAIAKYALASAGAAK